LGLWYGEEDSFKGFESLWWSEFSGSGGFLRPLASWALTLLHWTFGRNAVPFHAVLMIVHGLGAFAACLVLRRLSGNDTVALLAALLFLICEDHGMTVGWIATITDLLCALFLNLAFLSHIIARQERIPWLLGMSLALFLAAITSKETAAAYPLVIVAYEFFFADYLSDEQGQVNWRARLRLFFRHWWAWAIPLAVFAAYMVFYLSLVPALDSMAYTNPFSRPGRYLGMMLTNLPVMFVGLLSQMLPSVVLMFPGSFPIMMGAGLALVVLLVWALFPYRHQRALWFTLVVFVLGLLPGLATEPGERLLYFPSVYGLFVVAWLIIQIPRVRRVVMPDAPSSVRILGPAWGWYLLVSAVILPLILLFVYPSMWIPSFRLPEQTVLDSLPLIEEDTHEHIVYLNTNSSFNAFYLSDIYRYHRGQYPDLYLLSSFNGRIWARQELERTIVLRTEDAGWLNNMFARIVRVESELAVGDVYATELFTVTILAVRPDGQDVQEARFEFMFPLEDPSFAFLYYDGQSYRRWEGSPEWELLNATLDPLGY
jgi:hypothetical protein